MSSASPLWTPDPERARASHLHAFMTELAGRHGFDPSWETFRRWSVENRAMFWEAWLEWAGVEPSQPATSTLVDEGMLASRWFEGMHLNFARHLLRFDGDAPAIIFEAEDGHTREISRRELRNAVAACQAALRADGVQPGDRVAGFLPNLPETVIAMLAATSLGAIWSSCSPDFGTGGVLDRFGQIEPKILVTSNGYRYGGKSFDTLSRVQDLLPQLSGIERVVVVPFVEDLPATADLGDTPCTSWDDYLVENPPELTFHEVPFSHPLFIMYSSGTTGIPKCIVHGHGGTLLQHMKELMLHCDLRAEDRIFYFTTCGWMMWNWLVSSLGAGAAIVLYEGNPGYPSLDHLWDMAARHRVNVFGTSPKFLAACEKGDVHPGRDHDLSGLRAVLSTGAPLTAEQFRWVYQEIKSDLQLSSISGGTDIISCFILGNPMLPVYEGEIQCRGLAMEVEAWNDEGQPVHEEKGELVCRSSFPSQPVGFWNDPDGAKYRGAYFDHFPGVWRHGDFIEITTSGGIVVYGRSDATLNPGGVRIGTAEIYRVVESHPDVIDSIAVGKQDGDDVDIVLFVVLRDGVALDEDLKSTLRTSIASGATKRHVPRHLHQVQAIPYTISGKKVELAVQKMIHGEVVGNRDALANPESLEEYSRLYQTDQQ